MARILFSASEFSNSGGETLLRASGILFLLTRNPFWCEIILPISDCNSLNSIKLLIYWSTCVFLSFVSMGNILFLNRDFELSDLTVFELTVSYLYVSNLPLYQ